MFGVGGSELIVILIIALIFLGPDKLPDAAKQISKGIRDLKKQSRILQETIENDEHIGGALRDIKSALRGDDFAPARPAPKKQPAVKKSLPEGAVEAKPEKADDKAIAAGEPAEPAGDEPADEPSLIKPAKGTVAKGERETPAEAEPAAAASEPKQNHG